MLKEEGSRPAEGWLRREDSGWKIEEAALQGLSRIKECVLFEEIKAVPNVWNREPGGGEQEGGCGGRRGRSECVSRGWWGQGRMLRAWDVSSWQRRATERV